MFLAGPFQARGALKLAADGWTVEAPLFGRMWTFRIEIEPLPDLQLSHLIPYAAWCDGLPVEIFGASVWIYDRGVIARIDPTRRNESRPL